ncbi:MAG TPA: SMP-30/gluconolactonase/LRE family protein [Caulobacteraceae bacterium]|nr:SMP-30/gluconolactonase/LRE family protein [Caulobacteraceae bacterium]
MRLQPSLLAEGFLFAESPRWHAARRRFFISDIDRGQVFEISPSGERRLVYQAPGWVSGLAFEGSRHMLVVQALARKLVRIDLDDPDKGAEAVASAEALARFGLNDMIRRPDGFCYVATVDFDFAAHARGEGESRPSVLACIAPDGTATAATREVNFPNGMAIGPDGARLIVADSLDERLYAFALLEDGKLGPRALFAAMPGEMPDGISLDASGAVWVASHHRVLRVAEGGEVLDEVDMGPTRATACMLGGEDGRTLLITASDSHDRQVITKSPSGRLFTVRVDTPGAGLPSVYASEARP